MTQTERTDASISSNPSSGSPLAYPSLAAFEAHLGALGAKPAHLRRICRAWLGSASAAWPDALGAEAEQPARSRAARLPAVLMAALANIRSRLDAVLTVRSRHPGADPESERLLLTLADGQTIEEVLLPRRGVCVSTQMGCAVGCVFCMTGKGGLVRQLSDMEIAAQAALARRLRPETKKVVFMGMGEPSHNLDNVLRAAEFLALYGGFGHKDLVISTVGDERLFEALNRMSARPALAVSLHTTDDAKRRTLLPRGAKMTVKALTEAAEAWARKTGYPTQYQWTLIQGVNDGEEEVNRLIELLTCHYAMVNFIPVNAVDGSVYSRPDREHAAHLVRRLKSAGIVATLRDSAAQDVDGGCGQLRARVLSAESKARAEQAVRRTATPFDDRNSNA